MKNDEEKPEPDKDIETLNSLELIIKKAEAKKAQLDLKRVKLYHKKLLEIAGYDHERTI